MMTISTDFSGTEIFYPLLQLCANDILDGVDEFIESISLLPEPEKILHTQDTDHQHSSSHGEEEGTWSNWCFIIREVPSAHFRVVEDTVEQLLSDSVSEMLANN